MASQKVLDAQNRVNELVLREDWKDEYDQAVETLKKLQKELADLQTAQKQLQTEADDLATRIDDKEEAKAGYETDIAAAVKTMAEKEAEKDSVQKEYDAAAKIQEDLDKAADKALAEVQTADMKVAEAELRLHDQNASLELAEKAKEAADNKALAAAQKRLDDAMAEYSKGSSGFFEYLKDQGNKDAERAFAIINAKGTEMQDGRNKNTDISEYTHLGQKGDSTSLEYMKVAVDHLNDVNTYREKENEAEGKKLKDLKVTHSMMAIAQWNANYSAVVHGHAGSFSIAENVAWGYPNPYTGWYDKERALYKAGTTTFAKTGHYQNIVNDSYIVQGYAYVGAAGEFLQTFTSDWSTYASNAITVEEYQNVFNEYYNRVTQEKDAAEEYLKNVQDGTAEKTEEQKKAEEALKSLEQARDQAAESLNANQENRTAAGEKASEILEKLAAAKEVTGAFEAKLSALEKDIEKASTEKQAAEDEKNQVSAEINKLRSSVEETENRLSEVADRINAKQDETDKQQAKTDALEAEKQDFDTAKAQALKNQKEALKELSNLQYKVEMDNLQLGELEREKAQKNQDILETEASLAAAEDNLKKITNELAEAEKAYTAAQKKYEEDTALKKAADDAKSEVEKLEKEAAGLEKQIAEGKTLLSELKNKADELTQYIQNGKAHIEYLKAEAEKVYQKKFEKDGFVVDATTKTVSMLTDWKLAVERLEMLEDNYGLSGVETVGFDIHFVDADGKEIPVRGQFTVSIPVSKGKSRELKALYHKADKEADLVSLDYEVIEGTYQFETDSFSWFILAYEPEPEEPGDDISKPTDPSTPDNDNPKPENPDKPTDKDPEPEKPGDDVSKPTDPSTPDKDDPKPENPNKPTDKDPEPEKPGTDDSKPNKPSVPGENDSKPANPAKPGQTETKPKPGSLAKPNKEANKGGKKDTTVSAGATTVKTSAENAKPVAATAGNTHTSPNTGVGESAAGSLTTLLLSAASLAGIYAELKRRNRK